MDSAVSIYEYGVGFSLVNGSKYYYTFITINDNVMVVGVVDLTIHDMVRYLVPGTSGIHEKVRYLVSGMSNSATSSLLKIHG